MLKKRPRLSVLDQIIYWFLLAMIVGFLVAYFALYGGLRSKIAFSDEQVIASNWGVGAPWSMLPWMTTLCITLLSWLLAYMSRKPIFGLRNFDYRKSGWPPVYPLFMKNKPEVSVSKSKKKEQKVIAMIMVAALVISWLPFPLSVYGRHCLRSDGSIVQYNMLNKEIRQVSLDEIHSVVIETHRSTRGHYGGGVYGVRIVFVTESGRDYYTQWEFRDDVETDTAYWLTAMIQLKNCYDPDIVQVSGIENLARVIDDQKLSPPKVTLLYELFELHSFANIPDAKP